MGFFKTGSAGSGFAALYLLVGAAFVSTGAGAQTIAHDSSLSLKNGETLMLGDSYLISLDCKSLLKAPPEVEIMEGPPGVKVSLEEAMIIPYTNNCARPVKGSKVMIRAEDVEAYSHTTFVLRFKYVTRSGPRYYTHRYRLTLYP